ncbi:MAG: ethylbenzene dehydrogenase-related protein, partial [bacterium]
NVDSSGFSVTNALNPRWANDDQLALIIDNGGNGNEGANCALMCHTVEDSMWIGGGGVVDVWIWRAGRTNPLDLADDMIWGTDRREFDDYSQNREAWRRNGVNPDAEEGLTEPRWMHVDGPDYTGINLFTEDTTAMDFSGQYNWKQWDGVPGFVLEKDLKPSEAAKTSRYDVHAQAEYDSQADSWTLVLWRKLNTGNEDDFAFTQGTSLSASLAMMDHTDNYHSGSRVFTIKF